MPVYTAPNMSFLDSYVNAAKYRDERTDKKNQQLMEGVTNLVKGGANAYKWQERKNILDERKKLEERAREIQAEIDRLENGYDGTSYDQAGSTRNLDAINLGLDWNLLPRVTKTGGLI